jgi:hypothetical protein
MRGIRWGTSLVTVASFIVAFGGAAAVATPTQADTGAASCHWIDREYDSTYTCGAPTETVAPMTIVECWRYPPAPRTYVRHKTTEGWVRNALITVRVTGTKGCAAPYPYRTLVTVAPELLGEMTVTRLRLTMPASEGTLPSGIAYSFGKTVVTYGACLMPSDALDWCPPR